MSAEAEMNGAATHEPEPNLQENIAKLVEERIQANNQQLLAQMREVLTAVVPPATAPPQTTPGVPVEQELEPVLAEAIQTGDSAKLVAGIKRLAKSYAESEVTPLRTLGITGMAQLAREQALAAVPQAKRYAAEIDKLMAEQAPEARALASAWTQAARLVLAGHMDELTREAIEQDRRQRAQESEQKRSEEMSRPKPRPVLDDGTPVVNLLEEGGKELEAAFREKGNSPEEAARRMGYASLEDYERFAAKVMKEAEHFRWGTNQDA